MAPPSGSDEIWDRWLAEMPDPYLAGRGRPHRYLDQLVRHIRNHPPAASLTAPRPEKIIGVLNRRLAGLARVQYSGAKSRVGLGLATGALAIGSVPFPPLIPVAALTAWLAGLNEARVFQKSTDLERATDELSRLIDALIAEIDDGP